MGAAELPILCGRSHASGPQGQASSSGEIMVWGSRKLMDGARDHRTLVNGV